MTSYKRPRNMNISLILRRLWVEHTISRIQLSRNLNLNKSTISQIINELLERNIVVEVSEGSSGPQGGRKPVQLQLNKEFGYVLGIELRMDSWTAVAVDFGGKILFSHTETKTIYGDGIVTLCHHLLQTIPRQLENLNIPIKGAGIGVSGIIDSQKGIIRTSIPMRITSPLPIIGHLADTYSFPIYIDNDANSCAWGELAFHRTRQLQNFIFVLVEFHTSTYKRHHGQQHDQNYQPEACISVGLGIVIHGRVFPGIEHSAGEFRSIFCSPEDAGQFKVSKNLSPEEQYIDENREVFRNFVTELSKHVALFVNTFNLGQVFLGGDIEQHRDIITSHIKKEINANCSYKEGVDCEIHFSSQGKQAVAYGAAGLVFERLFVDPEVMDWSEDETLFA